MRSRESTRRLYFHSRQKVNEHSGGTTAGWLLALFLVLKPFYLWSSGLPQISDLVLLLLVTSRFFSKTKDHEVSGARSPFQVLAALFLYWSTVVNLSAALLVGEAAPFMIASAMNAYNIAVTMTIFSLFLNNPRNVARVLYMGSLVSITVQTVLLLAGALSGGLRATGTFNNPNQLAFHSILVISLLLISHEVLQYSTAKWTCLGVLLACVCVALSLSRAGAVAVVILLVGLFVAPPARRGQLWKFRGFLAISAVALVVLLWTSQNPNVVSWMDSFAGRANKQDASGFESGRGYDRILNYPEFWIFGAGEGAHWRFEDWHEFHSTLGTIQVSYGVIGLVLFIWLIATTLRRSPSHHIFVLRFSVVLAIMVYGVAHNGLRSTVSWICFAVLAAWSEVLTTGNSTTGAISSNVRARRNHELKRTVPGSPR